MQQADYLLMDFLLLAHLELAFKVLEVLHFHPYLLQEIDLLDFRPYSFKSIATLITIMDLVPNQAVVGKVLLILELRYLEAYQLEAFHP